MVIGSGRLQTWGLLARRISFYEKVKNMDYTCFSFNPPPVAENGGLAILPPGWIHPKRELNTAVLILGKKGKVTIDEKGRILEIAPNTVTLLSHNTPHKGKHKIESTASYYWFHFYYQTEPEIITLGEIASILDNSLVTRQRLATSALIPKQLKISESHHIHDLFRELLNEQENPSIVTWKMQLIFQNLLIAITEEAISNYREFSQDYPSTGLVNTIVSMIADHLVDPELCVKNIASALKYNPDYLGRQFKNIMKIGISEYLLQERIKISCHFLIDTNETLGVIAHKSGFSSLRHFLRQFKKVKGMTPTELRNRYKSMHINTQ